MRLFCQHLLLRCGQRIVRDIQNRSNRRQSHRSTQTHKPFQPHRAIASGNHQRITRCLQHRAGHAVACCRRCTRNGPDRTRNCDLGHAQRVPVPTKIQASQQRGDLRRRLREINHPQHQRPRIARKIAALAQVLRRPLGRATLQLRQHAAKALHPCGVAFGIEAEGRLVRRNLYQLLSQQIAFIHATLDHVPADAMLRLAVDDRPCGRVQARIARQRPVMEVNSAFGGQRQNRLRDDAQVCDAQ